MSGGHLSKIIICHAEIMISKLMFFSTFSGQQKYMRGNSPKFGISSSSSRNTIQYLNDFANYSTIDK